jgi:putative PEP-CTERM system histidine kinase
MYFAILSHALGAVGFLILFLLLLTSWRGRVKGGLLVIAVFIDMLWAMATTYYLSTDLYQSSFDMPVFEVIRGVAWLILLFELLKPLLITKYRNNEIHYFFYPGIISIGLLMLVVELFSSWFSDPELQLNTTMSGRIGMALIGLVMIEHLFRNTRPERRWATKFLYFGVGTLFAYDFFLYTDTLLFKRIDEQIWTARGLVHAIVVPFIALSTARNPDWSLDIFVSRRIVIHSVVVIGAGIYLLAMAGAGYYIQYFGSDWGTALQVVFFVGAGLVLITMIFSGHMRSIVTVFLSKHFFNYKYDYREEWLKFSDTLSSSELIEPLRERAVRAIAEILHSPGGLLWTRGSNGHFFLSANWNTPESGIHRVDGDSSLIDFLAFMPVFSLAMPCVGGAARASPIARFRAGSRPLLPRPRC